MNLKPETQRYLVAVEYVETRFSGSQKQPTCRTVVGVLEERFKNLLVNQFQCFVRRTLVTPPCKFSFRSNEGYKYVLELWRKYQSDVMEVSTEGDIICLEYTQHPSIFCITHPTRRLSYKAKQGYVVYRVRVRRGGRKTPVPNGIVYGKSTNQGVTQMKLQRRKISVAEERAARKLGGLRVSQLKLDQSSPQGQGAQMTYICEQEVQGTPWKRTLAPQGQALSQSNLEEEQRSLTTSYR